MSDVTVERFPIVLSPHAIALVEVFVKRYDNMEDIWKMDYLGDHHKSTDGAAKQLLDRLEDHWTPYFLMSLRRQITAKLAQHDQSCGTQFAQKLE